MFLAKTVKTLQEFLNSARNNGQSIGFVPTMGALHEGHLSLIRQAKDKSDLCVCSIFVNPTQFNDAKDLEKYPRTVEEDAKLLTSVQTDVLFLPNVNEVYPPGLNTDLSLDLGTFDKVMEGEFRPGHFEGMARFFVYGTKRLPAVEYCQKHDSAVGNTHSVGHVSNYSRTRRSGNEFSQSQIAEEGSSASVFNASGSSGGCSGNGNQDPR